MLIYSVQNWALAISTLSSFITPLTAHALDGAEGPLSSPNTPILTARALAQMRDTDAGILARIAAVENLQASTNFCPSSHRDTAFWSSFSGAKRFYYSFCRGYGLTGCQVLLAFNKNGLYIAHYWEAADGADREMRTNDIIKFIQNGDPDRLPEPDPDPNEEDIYCGPFPALTSEAELERTKLNNDAHMYLITIESERPRKQLDDIERVQKIVDATVGPQWEYKETIDNREPKGAITTNAGPMKDAHLKVHSYLPPYDPITNTWGITNVAVEYDHETQTLRGLIGGSHPAKLFDYKVDKPWNDKEMGASYAWSRTAEEEASYIAELEASCAAPGPSMSSKRDTTWSSLWARAGIFGGETTKTTTNRNCDSTSQDSTSLGSTSLGSTSEDSTSEDSTSEDSTFGGVTYGDATSGDATSGDATSGDATSGDATFDDANSGDATSGRSTSDRAAFGAATSKIGTAKEVSIED